MEIVNRHSMPTQAPSERIHNFEEVALGYTPELAQKEAERCLKCKNAPCMDGCPVGVRIPDFISRVKVGDMDGATEILKIDNNLASVCGRVCPQENQCEKNCVRISKLGGAVAIGNLERYVADYALAHQNAQKSNDEQLIDDIDWKLNDNKPIKKIGKSVGVVGSGPASLTCACELARAGVDVTIYEALHKVGGVLQYGIPEFRLPKDIVEKEIDKARQLGVKIMTNIVVGKTLFVQELLFEHDAVFIGTGAGVPQFLNIKGENLNGVYSANEYLTRVNLMKAYKDDSVTPLRKGKKVLIVGAGNVAMDSARTAVRLGADVTLVYRRSRAEMPARKEEIVHAEEEGVEFELLANPVEILGDEEGNVRGAVCVRMQLGEPDQSGRRRPVVIEGSEFTIDCDVIVVALGTSPNPIIKQSMPNLAVTQKGTIIADENGKTNIPHLYVGGDAMTGAATVILAMGAGKRSAKAILEELAK